MAEIKWPDYILEIIKPNTQQPNPERMSITQLGGCPLIRTLWLKYWDKIKQEPEDMLWMVYGNALDSIVKKHCRTGMTDLKFELLMDDFVVVGKPDIYYPQDKILVDLKTTSVWNLKEPRKEWIFQLNCYAYLMKRLMPNLEVTKLQVHGLGRDWRQNEKLRYGHDYPDSAFVIMDIPLWSYEEAEKVIDTHLKDHKFNCERECTPAEKWQKEDKWAVKGAGNKTAKGGKVCDSKQEADAFIASKPGKKWEIEFRPGECTRCKTYCNVSEFCKYKK